MSCETTMYALKPIVSLPDRLSHAKTMYKIRNVHERSSEEHVIERDVKEQSPLPEYSALEARQEKILAQLAELKKQVSTLCDFLKQTSQTEPAKDYRNKEPVNVSLVLKVNPKRPPYSILALQKVWNDTDIRIQEYVHSTVKGKVPIMFSASECSSKHNTINVSFIWKEVEDLELVTGLHCYSLSGEINFLRYISRLIDAHNYESLISASQACTIDTVLDLCHCLNFQDSAKNVQEILSSIGDKLGKNSWFGRKEPNIVDIAAWSVIKQVSPKKLPSSLHKWFETCEKTFT